MYTRAYVSLLQGAQLLSQFGFALVQFHFGYGLVVGYFRQVRFVVETGTFVEENVGGTGVHSRYFHVAVRTTEVVQRALRVVEAAGAGRASFVL